MTSGGCSQSAKGKGKGEKPSKVEKYPNESDIYRVTLTDAARKRLDIQTVSVARKKVRRQWTVGGILQLPAGATITVTAPVAGKVQLEAGLKKPGQVIGAKTQIATMVPLLTPERDVLTPAERFAVANTRMALLSAKIVVAGEVKQAQARVDGTKKLLDLAAELHKNGVGPKADVDRARIEYDVAIEQKKAADARAAMLAKIDLEGEKQGKLKPLPIVLSRGGVLLDQLVVPDQYVTAGTPIVRIAAQDKLWVRVPIYAGRATTIAPGNAFVLPLKTTRPEANDAAFGIRVASNARDKNAMTATPIPAPPTADPIGATVDLYFSIDNAGGTLAPGERVTVSLPLNGKDDYLVIPRAAVLRDIHGIAWVYVETAKNEYRRKRVLIDFTTEELAVLEAGLDEQEKVVVDGAAELFGTEFGTKK